MKQQLTRKDFLHATMSTSLLALIGCSSDDGDPASMGSGGGTGSGGSSSGGSSASTGGAGTGGAGSGGESSSGGSGTGGTSNTGGESASGGTGGSGGLTCTQDITVTSSGEAHTHDLTVTALQLDAGVEVMLVTSESVGHSHCLTLSAAEIMQIKNGGTVKKVTCNYSDHEFVISCDPSADAPTIPTTCGDADTTGQCP